MSYRSLETELQLGRAPPSSKLVSYSLISFLICAEFSALPGDPSPLNFKVLRCSSWCLQQCHSHGRSALGHTDCALMKRACLLCHSSLYP